MHVSRKKVGNIVELWLESLIDVSKVHFDRIILQSELSDLNSYGKCHV